MKSLHNCQSNHAWVDDAEHGHHLEPTYEPNIADEIDGPEEGAISEEDALTAMAKILNAVLYYCFPGSSTKTPDLSQGFRRFVCVVWALRPEMFDHASLATLAPHLHVTRSALSAIVRKFCDQHGVRNVLMKNETARATYRKAQIEDHWRRRPQKKPGTPVEMPGPREELAIPHSEVVI
jgi:hypothetical protein